MTMGRITGLIALFLLTITFPPGVGAAAAPAPPRGASRDEGIELSDSAGGLDQGATSRSFNLMELRDLWVRVKVNRMPRTAMLTLTFINPRGEVFYETNVLYSHDTRAREVRVPGASHTITAFPARPVPGGFALDQSIPIGSGVFMRYPQPGTWLVRATLEGHHEALAVRMDLGVTP
jgi:hypothetical protein